MFTLLKGNNPMKNLDFLPTEVKNAVQNQIDSAAAKAKHFQDQTAELINSGEVGMDEKEFDYVKYIDSFYSKMVEELDATSKSSDSSKELVKRAKELKKELLSVFKCTFIPADIVTKCKDNYTKADMIAAKSRAILKMSNSKEYEFNDPKLITTYMAQSGLFTEADHDLLQYIFYTWVNENHLANVEHLANEFISSMSLLTVARFVGTDSEWLNILVKGLRSLLKVKKTIK